MIMVMSMMMSMAGSMILIPLSLILGVWAYRTYWKDPEDEPGDLDKDPGKVDSGCVVLMNNTPDDNPNGVTKKICLGTDETSRKVDLKHEMKELHDEISAARVGKGLYLDVYEHKAYGGKSLRLDGDALREDEVVNFTQKCLTDDGSCGDGGSKWNDNISSFQIIRKES
jgi:hypothetical protein